MKINIINIKSLALLLFLAFVTISCDDFLDVNDNPNSPVEVGPNLILANSELGFAAEMGSGAIHLMSGAFIQHYAGTNNQLASYDTYGISGDNLNNSWLFNGYSGFLNHSNDLMVQASDDPANIHYLGIGKILNAFQFAVFTDVWGDIPFSEALDRQNFKSPRFDTQQSIYTALIVQIKSGIADLQQTGAAAVTDDLIYGGDIRLWQKAGNSLLLKLYLQIRKVDPNLASQGFNEVLVDDNYISDNDEDMELLFLREETNQHPLFDFAVNNRPGDIAISQRFIDSLTTANDPRIDFFFVDQNQGSFIGYDNGSTLAVPTLGTRARLGEYVIDFDGNSSNTGGAAPYRFLTNFQTLFNRAEAALFLNTGEDARQMFQMAIEASMREVGVQDADDYITDRLAAYDAASTDEQRLNVIIRDKWHAWIGNPYEAWNDFRRTNYPQLQVAQNPVGINSIPSSLPYSSNELSANPNAPAQKLPNVKVWWDVD